LGLTNAHATIRMATRTVALDFVEPVGVIERVGGEPRVLRLDPIGECPSVDAGSFTVLRAIPPSSYRRARRLLGPIERFQAVSHFEKLQRGGSHGFGDGRIGFRRTDGNAVREANHRLIPIAFRLGQ
jgi:hypothetical protein